MGQRSGARPAAASASASGASRLRTSTWRATTSPKSSILRPLSKDDCFNRAQLSYNVRKIEARADMHCPKICLPGGVWAMASPLEASPLSMSLPEVYQKGHRGSSTAWPSLRRNGRLQPERPHQVSDDGAGRDLQRHVVLGYRCGQVKRPAREGPRRHRRFLGRSLRRARRLGIERGRPCRHEGNWRQGQILPRRPRSGQSARARRHLGAGAGAWIPRLAAGADRGPGA